MTPAGFDRLGPRAAQAFLAFVADPASWIHPRWVERLVPEPLRESAAADPAVISRGLMAAQGWEPALPAFRFADPAHRAALLPADGLDALARALGLRACASELQRLIARDDVLRMAAALTEPDRRLLETLIASRAAGDTASAGERAADAGTSAWPPQGPPPLDVADLLEALPSRGHQLLAHALSALDGAIGARALLKVPPAEADPAAPQPASAAPALDWLREVYPAVIGDWDPQWEAMWQPHPEITAVEV